MEKQPSLVKPIIKVFVASTTLVLSAQTASAQTGQDAARAAMVPATTGLPAITNTRAEIRNAGPNARDTGLNVRDAASTGARAPSMMVASKNAFEDYVEKVTGTPINTFGKELFGDVPNTFAPIGAVQVNPDYLIGPGDELQIRGWGMVDIDLSTTVDRNGTIYIPRVGAVKVSGIKYRDLQGYLKTAIGRIYSNFELTASVSQTRAVQVYVVGHAVRPGTYTLNAMSTLLNALFASGGPDGTGTMRNIEVKRGAATVTTFDLYDMLLKGDKTRDIALQDGDVIHIPEVGPLVALTGNVKRPSIFELKGQSSIADAVNWAGGFDSAAELKQVIVEKNVNNTYQTVADVVAGNGSVTGRLASIPLQPTDIVRIFAPSAVPVQAQITNEYVRVAGEVVKSGVVQIRKGETLRELIARLGGVTENGYVYGTKLTRESVRRDQQAKLDTAAERFERDVEANASQRLAASTDKDYAATVAAETERQRRLAQKLRSVKAEGRIVLELPDGEAQVKHLPDLALHNGDSVYIPRKPGTVDVIGAVFQQNAFIYRPHRLVNDYLALAGGPTVTADSSELYVIHADGTTQSGNSGGWLGGVGGAKVNAGDAIVVPEKLERSSWTQSLKEWTSIFYQFGLGAAGLKVLKN